MNNKIFIKNLLIVIIGVYIVLSISVIQEIFFKNDGIYYYLPVAIGLGIIPSIIIGNKNIVNLITFNNMVICCSLVVCSSIFSKLKLLDSIGMGIIVFSEEFSFRYCLISKKSSNYEVIISAIAFAFVLHNNEPFITNILIRFPMGILLGYVFRKSNSIAFVFGIHYLYNIVQVY